MKEVHKPKKNKPPHSLWSNTKYLYQLQWKYCKISFIFLLILIPVNLGLSYCGIYLPRIAVSAIIENFTFRKIVYSIGLIGLVIAVLNSASQLITTYNSALMTRFRESLVYLKTKKILYTDYQNLESSKYRLMMQRADESLWGSGDGSAIEQMVQGGTKLITSALGYILFGAVLSFASPWIVLILTIMPIVDYFLIQGIQKYQYASKGETSSLDRKLWYIATKAGDYKAAKDIRIYSISTWLIGLYKRITKERLGWDKKYAARYFLADILHGIMILFRDSGAYIILISMVLNDNISIDEFVMYFAAVSGFANWVGGIISELTKMSAINLNACDLRDFLSCREKNNRGTGCVLPDPTKPCAIKLEDVCFQYEGADKNTINHISLDIHAGEKVAIVGLNGTGKTTLIKLLCGLYTPDTGDIYINEKNKNEYNIYEYYSLFSTVFQDHHFLPISLARIVSCAQDGEVDGQKVYECLSISGFRDKIDSLRDGLGTRLNKQINNDAVELSGGEEQKLLLARALYKDARILILDEPTASLDPIAESNLYLQYKDMCTNKTAIFISHRLASTKFCDRILFMENGEIAETGAHDELLRQGGKYAAMFETQSQYYTEQKEVLK